MPGVNKMTHLVLEVTRLSPQTFLWLLSTAFSPFAAAVLAPPGRKSFTRCLVKYVNVSEKGFFRV
jgi:hypothetical protein